MPRRGGGLVLWRKIAQEIEDRIEKGLYSPGTKLPTENDFAAEFGVNRHTVRRALLDVQDKGQIDVTQGRGSYVRYHSIGVRLTDIWPWPDGLSIRRLETEEDLSWPLEGVANRTQARHLKISAGEPVTGYGAILFHEELPVALSRGCVSARRYPAMAAALGSRTTPREALRACLSVPLSRQVVSVSARLAHPKELAALSLQHFSPLLVVDSVLGISSDTPVLFERCLWASDRVNLHADFLH